MSTAAKQQTATQPFDSQLSSNIDIDKQHINNNNIEQSWATIKAIEHSIVEKSDLLNWHRVMHDFKLRQRHISIHFKNFPVGPSHAFFYKKHLSDYFSSEDYFQELHSQAVRNCLRLV